MKHTVKLTPRDVAILRFIGENKSAPMDVLALRFFLGDELKPNRDPAHACRRRLAALRAAGYLDDKTIPAQKRGEWTRAVRLTRQASDVLGLARPGTLHPRGRDHHMATLRGIEQYRAQLAKTGGTIVDVALEHTLRSREQHGHTTRRGDSFSSFPDALVTVRDAAGVERSVALEYVTSKYTSQMILDKAADFAAQGWGTVWIADSISTSRRVEALTEDSCSWL